MDVHSALKSTVPNCCSQWTSPHSWVSPFIPHQTYKEQGSTSVSVKFPLLVLASVISEDLPTCTDDIMVSEAPATTGLSVFASHVVVPMSPYFHSSFWRWAASCSSPSMSPNWILLLSLMTFYWTSISWIVPCTERWMTPDDGWFRMTVDPTGHLLMDDSGWRMTAVKAGMVHSVSLCTQGVQVKLWDPLRTHAIPERLRGVITTRRYTNPRLLLPLPRWQMTLNDTGGQMMPDNSRWWITPDDGWLRMTPADGWHQTTDDRGWHLLMDNDNPDDSLLWMTPGDPGWHLPTGDGGWWISPGEGWLQIKFQNLQQLSLLFMNMPRYLWFTSVNQSC